MPKDACYRKVKARYSVFPSAYASGAIAKCRKVGAANYGKSKKRKKSSSGVARATGGGYGKALERAANRRKRASSQKNVARGCGKVMSDRRKVTKYA
tara:strand:- start:1297 stop:1587 length:291 start_codon:yes stop_codon:yes gene_type:complete